MLSNRSLCFCVRFCFVHCPSSARLLLPITSGRHDIWHVDFRQRTSFVRIDLSIRSGCPVRRLYSVCNRSLYSLVRSCHYRPLIFGSLLYGFCRMGPLLDLKVVLTALKYQLLVVLSCRRSPEVRSSSPLLRLNKYIRTPERCCPSRNQIRGTHRTQPAKKRNTDCPVISLLIPRRLFLLRGACVRTGRIVCRLSSPTSNRRAKSRLATRLR